MDGAEAAEDNGEAACKPEHTIPTVKYGGGSIRLLGRELYRIDGIIGNNKMWKN